MSKSLQFLPIATIVVLTISFLNIHFYYNSFGLIIHNYLDVSEVIFSNIAFVSSGLTFLFFAIYLKIVTSRTSPRVKFNFQEEGKLYKQLKTSKSAFVRFISWFTKGANAGILIFTALLMLFAVYFSGVHPDDELLSSAHDYDFDWYILIIFVATYACVFSLWLREGDKFSIGDVTILFMTMGLMIIIFLSHRADKSAGFVKAGHPKYEVLIATKSDSIQSNNSLVFIGGTRNFYFLYDRKDSTSLIIPSTDIVVVEIKKLRGGL